MLRDQLQVKFDIILAIIVNNYLGDKIQVLVVPFSPQTRDPHVARPLNPTPTHLA